MILKIKDENGNWIPVPAIKGPKGDPGPEGPAGPEGPQGSKDAILYTEQSLTEEQKAQARENIGIDLENLDGSVSWEKVKNKPFEEISPGQDFFWDGNTENLPYEKIEIDVGSDVPMVLTWYKISNIILSEADVKKSEFSFLMRDGDDLELISLPIDTIKGKTPNGSFYATYSTYLAPFLIICNSAGDTIEENIDGMDLSVTLPEEGLWFLKQTYYGEEMMRVTSLTVPPEIKTIDSKYLPDGCAGREVGTKILWDGAPTDTYVQPGWDIEWDGSDTGVSCPLVSNPNSEMAAPEGAAFYKVSEKLDSLVGLTFELNGGYIELNSDSVLTYLDENNGQVIATFGSSNMPFVWNVEKPGRVVLDGNEVVFEEEGLYFLKTSDEYYVERIYDEIYGEIGDSKLYKISEPINDTLDGYILNLLDEDNEEMEIPLSDGEVLFGKTATGSSYAAPYVFNIKTDNEKIEVDVGELESEFSFNFEKAGLYIFDFSIQGATFNFLAGRDYQFFKINKKFLPNGMTYIENSDDSYPTSGAVYRALGNRDQLSIQSDINLWSNDPVSSSAVYRALGDRNRLEFDHMPQNGSNNLVTSGAVYSAIENKKITVDSIVQSGSNNAVSGNAVYNALGYRNQLNFDNTPTSGSSNLITSGDVYTALQNNKVTVSSSVLNNGNAVSGSAVYKALGYRNQLNFENTPTSGSSNLITSDGIYTALGNRSKISTDTSPINGSSNLITSGGIYTALGNRSKISTDTSPINGSSHFITSGAVYTALDKKMNNVSVNITDNGKFMRVVNGVWSAVAISNAEDGEF